jgi:putative transposase
VLGPKVKHRCNAYLNRRIEQDHRGIKQRYYPMLGFWLTSLRPPLLPSI